MNEEKRKRIVVCPECHGTGLWTVENNAPNVDADCPKCQGEGCVPEADSDE